MNLQKRMIGLGFLLFFLLLLGILFFLISSTSGLNLLFRATNFLWTPGLEIGKISGNLHNLYLENISYKRSGVDTNINEARLSFSFDCLRNRKIYVNKLSLNNIRTVIDPIKFWETEKINKKEKLYKKNIFFFLSWIYPIIIDYIKLDNINIKIDKTPLYIKNITSGISLYKNQFSIKPTLLQELLITPQKTEKDLQRKIFRRKPKNFLLERSSFIKMTKTFFSKLVSLKPNAVDLMSNRNSQEEYLKLINRDKISIQSIFLIANGSNRKAYLNLFSIISDYGKIDISGKICLQKNWPVNITINTSLKITPSFNEKINLKVNGKIYEKLEAIANLSGSVNMALRVKAQLIKDKLLLDAKAMSRQISWPFSEKKIFEANDFSFKVIGSVDNYILSFSTLINGENFLPITVILNASGSKQQINLKRLTIVSPNGKIETTALFNWNQIIGLHNQIKPYEVGIIKKIKNLPIKLKNLTSSVYNFYNKKWEVDVPRLKIIGNFKKNRVNIEGSLKSDNDLQLKISNLNIMFGCNNIRIGGEIGRKKLDFITVVNAPSLENIISGFDGKMRGSLKIQSTIKTNRLLANIDVNDLHWKKTSITHIHLNSNIRSDNQVKGKLKIQIDNIVKSKSKIKLITLDIKGNEKIHSANLEVQGNSVSGQLYLTGTFNKSKNYWHGQLNSTPLDTPSGLWKLSQSITLDFYNYKRKIRIGSHCWNNKNIKFCLLKTFHTDQNGCMEVNFDYFKLKPLRLFKPSSSQISRTLSGKVNIFWDIEEKNFPCGKIIFTGKNIKIFQVKNNLLLPIVLDIFNLRLDFYSKYVGFSWLAHFSDGSQVDGKIKITDPHRFRSLTGNINVNNFNLEIFSESIPFVKGITGILEANLQFFGNASVPKIFGKMKVYCMSINNSSLPIDIQPSQMALNFNGTHSTLIGDLCSLQGTIKLKGEADWNQPDQRVMRVELKSKKIHIITLPMMRFDISPNVIFEAVPNSLTLHGHITVPWMRVTIRELPESSIKISNDEIILDKNLRPISSRNINIPINSNLTLHMGKDVQMEAFGIKAKLTGDIKVIQDKRGLNLNGQIKVTEGRFYAYGQDLLIQKGDLFFFGSPSRPLFNIEAIRNPEVTGNNVTVGVHVTGTLDEPKIEIFSCPKMSQQEALSYLLRGRGLNSKQNDSTTMTSILVQLGATQSSQIIDKIGKIFGVANLTLGTQKTGDSSQIVLSGYVLPNLQIKYGMGIFDSLSMFTLRYQLLPKLYLEMIYGINQTLNLLYRFEF